MIWLGEGDPVHRYERIVHALPSAGVMVRTRPSWRWSGKAWMGLIVNSGRKRILSGVLS
ncbi:MAG: hypothetical protein ACYCY1_01710 [Sulfuriferula sp.]